MSHLYIVEDLNLLQHWCTAGRNKLKEQKFGCCYCMDCNFSDCNARDDVRTGISHYYHVPFHEVGTPQINYA